MQVDKVADLVGQITLDQPKVPDQVVTKVRQLLAAGKVSATPQEIGGFTAYFSEKKPRVLLLSTQELNYIGSQETRFYRAYSCTAAKIKEVVAMSIPVSKQGTRRNELMQMLAVKEVFPKNYGFYTTGLGYIVFQEKATCDLLEHYEKQHGLFRLTFQKKKDHFRSLLGAAALLRKEKIIHRDIKLDNVLVCKGGRLKLTDLGYAHRLDDKEATNTVCGTLQILAPEVVCWLYLKQPKPEIGFEADIWALGLLLHGFTCDEMPDYQWTLYKLGDLNQDLNNINRALSLLEKSQVSTQDLAFVKNCLSQYEVRLSPSAAGTIKQEKLRECKVKIEAKRKQQLDLWLEQIRVLAPRPKVITCLHDIVLSMLQINPQERITPDEALAALELCTH